MPPPTWCIEAVRPVAAVRPRNGIERATACPLLESRRGRDDWATALLLHNGRKPHGWLWGHSERATAHRFLVDRGQSLCDDTPGFGVFARFRLTMANNGAWDFCSLDEFDVFPWGDGGTSPTPGSGADKDWLRDLGWAAHGNCGCMADAEGHFWLDKVDAC